MLGVLGTGLAFESISYFKFEEGGWIDPGGGRERRDPAAHVAETDVDAIANPGRYGADEKFVFQKSFVAGDITFVGPSTIRLRCFLDFGEANDDGFANDPEFWGLAVFDSDDNMLVYATFPKQTKNNAVQLTEFVNLVF